MGVPEVQKSLLEPPSTQVVKCQVQDVPPASCELATVSVSPGGPPMNGPGVPLLPQGAFMSRA
jgi:hypothetical protein